MPQFFSRRQKAGPGNAPLDAPRQAHRSLAPDSTDTTDASRAMQLPQSDNSQNLAGSGQRSSAPEAKTETRAKRQAWRVRGVPVAFDKKSLADALRSHPSLSLSNELKDENGIYIHTLAPDVRLSEQVAIVRFRNIPLQLKSLDPDSHLTIEIPAADDAAYANTDMKGKQNAAQIATLLIDQHFDGITVLSPPSAEHHVDILAISGLGSHPFGSFVHKEDGHMWLADSLPRDLPSARVMIYGYKSGLQYSTSFARLKDLASSLQIALCSLLRTGKRRLILIGHSLGGLLVKEALIRMADSDYDSDLVGLVFGCLFFGVPNDGMDIESLVPIVNNQPNRQLLESLDAMNPQILGLQGRNFSKVLDEANFELFCFFETRLSPTAAKDPSTGQYRMTGPPRCLVTATSATSCLPAGRSLNHYAAIDRSHSDLVKLATRDAAYDNIIYILGQICERCLAVLKKSAKGGSSRGDDNGLFLVPYASNPDFVGRTAALKQLKSQLSGGRPRTDGQPQARSALYGLGGIGKTQIALAYAYWLREACPETSVFWVHGSSAERFRQGFASIAETCRVPGYDDPKADVLSLVKRWLERKERGPWLMVIDNADDAQVFGRPAALAGASTASAPTVSSQRDFRRYVPECTHGAVLVTTRNKQAGLWLTQVKHIVEIGKMDDDESGQLLRAVLDGDVASGDLSVLSSRLEHLPLALVQAAAFMQKNTMTVSSYLALLDKGGQGLVDLLSEEFETVGRDSGTPRAVAATWMLSFEQIQQQDTLAGDLLSLMSLLDRQAIPIEFLSDFSKQQDPGVGDVQLTKAIGLLKAFSLVTEDKDDSFDMHRLVQLVTRKWLANEGTIQVFAGQALLTVSHAYPYGEFETRATCRAYLPHAQAVLGLEGSGSEDKVMAKGTLLHSVAGFFLIEGTWNGAEKFLMQAVDIRRVVLGEDHPSTLTSMANLASTYRNQGRWKEAESLEVQVIETFKRVLGEEHPSTLTSMANLASTYRNQGRWKEAESLEVQVIETRKRVLGEEHPETLTSMANLASTYRNQGRWKEAESLEVQVIETFKRVLGEEHPSTLTSMANLASTYRNQGRWKEAESLEVQVIETRKRVLGEEHPSTLTSMANLASTYRNQGRWKEAESLEVQVIETFKRVLGEEHPSTLTSMANLASTYSNQGRWKEAESLEVQVIETFKRVLGEEHPETLTSMANLASTYRNQGRWKEAESLEVQVIETRKRVLGEEHPETLTSMANLASTYRNQGRWKEAESLEVQVIETRKRVLGEEHPSTLTSMANLASTYRNQGRWKEAESLEVQVIETFKRVLGEEHPSTLTSMANLASTYSNQGRWKEAESLEVQVIETFKRVLGEEHPETLTSMANLASTYRNQGRWKEAESLEVQVIETFKRVLGEEHPETLTSMANLASTYRNQGRWKEAESLEVQVIETRKRVLGEEHPETLTSMANLASTYRNQGRWKEAESLEVQVIETRKRVLGEEHPSTLTSMNNLAFTLKGQGRHADAQALMKACAQAQQRILGPEHPSTLSSLSAATNWGN